jgi:transcriptional regulator with XRE-family HTH domain
MVEQADQGSGDESVHNEQDTSPRGDGKAEEMVLSGGNEADQRRMGQRLKESREYLGLSQQLVAARTGIPRTAMSDIERGLRKVDSFELNKLAYLYRKPVEYFIDSDPAADPSMHTVQYLTRAAAGMTGEDQRKLVDYARLLEVAARAQQRRQRR